MKNAVVSAFTTLAMFALLGVAWDITWEQTPPASQAISAGYLRIQETKEETRNRTETEHDFGTMGDIGDDTGRHRQGSALAFYASGSATVNDCAGVAGLTEADNLGSTAFGLDDAGRMCFDSDDSDLYFWSGASWVLAFEGAAIPTVGTVVMRDTNTPCPTGWANITKTEGYEGLTIRGADLDADIADIIDVGDLPGSCINDGGDAASCPAADEADDFLNEAEMAAHAHDLILPTRNSDGGDPSVVREGDPSGNDQTWIPGDAACTGASCGIQETGGATAHYHPYKGVIFCRKL